MSDKTDINFPMKGRKGMVDWARNPEDKVVIPKGIFVPQTAGTSFYYVTLQMLRMHLVASTLKIHQHDLINPCKHWDLT